MKKINLEKVKRPLKEKVITARVTKENHEWFLKNHIDLNKLLDEIKTQSIK